MNIEISFLNRAREWQSAGTANGAEPFEFQAEDIAIGVTFRKVSDAVTSYHLTLRAGFDTRVRLSARQAGAAPWHLIPCNIMGDNNLEHSQPEEFPNLTTRYPGKTFASPHWEFRADRAALPFSALITDGGLRAVSIAPYARDGAGAVVRNGVFSTLPDAFGVTLGYENFPCTFTNKRTPSPATEQLLREAETDGFLFDYPGAGKPEVRKIIDFLYAEYREVPSYRKSLPQAARGLIDCFVEQNWSDRFAHYTNQSTAASHGEKLEPWRAVYEIAWTGGAIIAYPFRKAEKLLSLPGGFFAGRKDGMTLFQEIIDSYNPASGLFFDLTHPLEGSRINGWWTGMIGRGYHAAYTNGQALYYLYKVLLEMREQGESIPEGWEARLRGIAETHVKLQREDGCFGYLFSPDKPEVVDFDGFAGCWIAVAMALAATFTGNAEWLASAERAAAYYHRSVADLAACGTPMDTWKAPDQEGNLAFLKLVKALHLQTGNPAYLAMLEDGAYYEYLWRYGFKAIPECPPLAGSGWNSCGGSITSVSNPHVHPMGLIAVEDLYYLADQTGNEVHRQRALDSVAWAMNCLELYPEISGYGRYGVLTERYCPSDGLTIETYPDGRNSSMWFSYNAWAAANVLEALLWAIEHNIDEKVK